MLRDDQWPKTLVDMGQGKNYRRPRERRVVDDAQWRTAALAAISIWQAEQSPSALSADNEQGVNGESAIVDSTVMRAHLCAADVFKKVSFPGLATQSWRVQRQNPYQRGWLGLPVAVYRDRQTMSYYHSNPMLIAGCTCQQVIADRGYDAAIFSQFGDALAGHAGCLAV